MGRIRFTLSTVLFYVIMAAVCLLIENISFFSSNSAAGFGVISFFLLAIFVVFTSLLYLGIEHKRNKMKIDFILLPVLLIGFVLGLVAIWSNTNITTFIDSVSGSEITIQITTTDKIRYSIELAIVLITIYLMTFVFGKGKIRARKLVWMPLLVMVAGAVLCVISLFKDSYVFNYFTTGVITKDSEGAKSVFYNENVFGLFLLLSLFSSFVVLYHNRKWWWVWGVIFFFNAYLVLTTSVTSILIGFVATSIYILLEIIFGFIHKKYVATTIVVILFGASITGFILFLAIDNSSFSTAITDFIKKTILFKDVSTFTGRVSVWKAAIDMVGNDPFRIMLGYGYGVSKVFLRGFATTRVFAFQVNSAHSGFLQIYIMGGMIGLASYVLLLIYYLYCSFRLLLKKKIHFTLVYGLIFTGLIAHGCFESTYMLQVSTMGIIVSIVFFLPPIVAWKQIRHEKYVKSIETFYAIPTQGVPSHSFVPMVSNAILALLIPVIMLFALPQAYSSKGFMTILLLVIGALSLCLLFIPYLSFLFYRKSTNAGFITRIILNSIWIFGVPVLASYFVHEFIKNSRYIYLIVGGTTLFVTLAFATIVYSLLREGSFKQWAKLTFGSIFTNATLSKIILIMVCSIGNIILSRTIAIDYTSMIALSLIYMMVFWFFYNVIPSKKKEMIYNDFNEEGILELKRIYLEDTV